MSRELDIVKEFIGERIADLKKDLKEDLAGAFREIRSTKDKLEAHALDLGAHGLAAVEKKEEKDTKQADTSALRSAATVAWISLVITVVTNVWPPLKTGLLSIVAAYAEKETKK